MKLKSYKKFGFDEEMQSYKYRFVFENGDGTTEFLFYISKEKEDDFVFDETNIELQNKYNEVRDWAAGLKKQMDKARQKWRDLERNDPEEYRRRVAAMQPIIDRYNSEFGIADDETEDDEYERL
ncbi:hypothetical protein [Viscerimonas tarda]